ncbi:hypothetical protein DRN97_02345 [Methanosarcinales archaeon]|nr:MAG: hypothetical protein DRN97_02345 [Methanosarcinales archaeon]
MHSLVYFIIIAKEEGDALAKAEDYAMEWRGCGVDYYSMPTDPFFKQRWGVRKVLPVDSKEGKKLLEELIKTNINVMHDESNKAKEAIDKGDLGDALYHLRMAGGHPYSMFAFVDTTEPLISEGQIEEMKACISDKEKLWLVPVDIHY